jgi:tRNA G46 methylase TrmB
MIAMLGSFNRQSRKFSRIEELRRLYEIYDDPRNDQRLQFIVAKNANNFADYTISKSKHLLTMNVAAFHRAKEFVDQFYLGSNAQSEKVVILDSGCGQGLSTQTIGSMYPNIPCIGIDRSLTRLSSNPHYQETDGNSCKSSNHDSIISNVLLVRADLLDFWILAAFHSDWIIDRHFLIHPNPYPKHSHIKQRFYAHSIFPIIPILGGQFFLRSNWKTYAQEFRESIVILRKCSGFQQLPDSLALLPQVGDFDPSLVFSHFDRKYMQVGTPMYDFPVNFKPQCGETRRKWLEI